MLSVCYGNSMSKCILHISLTWGGGGGGGGGGAKLPIVCVHIQYSCKVTSLCHGKSKFGSEQFGH